MRHDDISDSFNSPMKVMDGSNNVFKAYDVDKLHTPKKTEFEYNDAHSPVSAKKFIERSLHDLDDLINQRRLELSELKRSHSSPNPTSSPPVSPLSVCLCVCVCLSLCVCVCVCVSLSLCLRIPSSCIFLLLNISLHEKHCA
jgi:hypothetical protein